MNLGVWYHFTPTYFPVAWKSCLSTGNGSGWRGSATASLTICSYVSRLLPSPPPHASFKKWRANSANCRWGPAPSALLVCGGAPKLRWRDSSPRLIHRCKTTTTEDFDRPSWFGGPDTFLLIKSIQGIRRLCGMGRRAIVPVSACFFFPPSLMLIASLPRSGYWHLKVQRWRSRRMWGEVEIYHWS